MGVADLFGSSEGLLGQSAPDDPTLALASDLAIVEYQVRQTTSGIDIAVVASAGSEHELDVDEDGGFHYR